MTLLLLVMLTVTKSLPNRAQDLTKEEKTAAWQSLKTMDGGVNVSRTKLPAQLLSTRSTLECFSDMFAGCDLLGLAHTAAVSASSFESV